MTGTIWDKVLARIETKVNRYSYYTWFKNTSLLNDDGTSLSIRVSDPMVVDWLTKHYGGVLDEALVEVGRPGVSLTFVPETLDVRDLQPLPVRKSARNRPTSITGPEETADMLGLSPRYSFDTFIVGASNQFAHAACRAVAEAPSRSYNPLFIYGGVGLGKTHLMHAIGHYVLTHNPG